jgi:hypothetical protein
MLFSVSPSTDITEQEAAEKALTDAAPSESHLFDALYTTRDESPGLDLSIRRKVAAHGERIWLT